MFSCSTCSHVIMIPHVLMFSCSHVIMIPHVPMFYIRGFQPGVRGPLVVRNGIAGGQRHEPMLVSSPLTFFIFIKYLGPSTYLCLNSQVALPKILMQTHIQRRNYTDKYYRQNMCAGGRGRGGGG